MAAESTVESLQAEVTCPICLEYFTAPVTLECGHNFCQACVSRCWEDPDTATSCPQCRETVQQRRLRLNRQLANVVEIAKWLSLKAAQGAEGDGMCGEHQEALKLFCEEDQTPICVVCDKSQAHCAHTVVLIQEAAQEYKEKFEAHLKTLREEREKLLGWKAMGEGRSQEYLKQTQAKRQRIVAEFQQLRQFLEEQEQLLLAQLEKLEEEIVRLQADTVKKLSSRISSLSELIGELEGTCQQPASEFLQDARSTLSRCEKGQFQQPVEIPPELEERVSGFSQKITVLLESLREFKDTLPSALEGARGNSLGTFRQAHVTLDQNTAHPELVLSEDWRSVRWAGPQQPLPDTPERFNSLFCVLGREGFTSGRHCWVVEVGFGPYWAVGVARESIRRKGQISRSPEGGIWAVELWGGQFRVLTSPVTPLAMTWAPSRIWICLDCDRGQVTFINGADEAPIFTFLPGSLPRERIHPWLGVWTGSWLSLCT